MNDSLTLKRVEDLVQLFIFGGLLVLLSSVSLQAQLSVNVSGTDPSCNGFTNGTVTAAATGGIPPYNYSWNNGETGPSIFGVGAGSYSVTVTDMMGTATGSTTLSQPSSMTTQAISTGTSCATAGGIDVNVSGGVAPYSYSWSNGSTSKSQSGLPSGLYCVTVSDANGCESASCIGVVGPLMVDVTTFDSRCAFACDGAANAIVTGGTGPYTYSWNTGGSTPTISPLGPGTYTVTVTDANGCMVIGTGVVSEPPPVILTINSQNPGCTNGNGGSISITSTGGVGPYSYLWNTGQTTGTINNLSAGTYIANVTDANGCVKDTMVVLTGGSVNLIVNSSDVTCGGSDDGTATAFASNGTAPYTYEWSNGMTGTFIGNLSPGSYSVTATDGAGCSASNSVTVGAGGSSLNLNFTSNDEGCGGANDGSAGVTASGGSGNYTYSWSNGMSTSNISNLGAGSYSVTVNDGTGCSATGSVVINSGGNISLTGNGTDIPCGATNTGTASVSPSGGTAPYTFAWSNGGSTQSISSLAAGTYTVTATDSNGCSSTTTVTINAASDPSINVTSVDPMCHGIEDGSATVTATSGGTLTYSWSNGATTSTISNLGAGVYSVTATNSDGCTSTGSVTINAPSGAVTGSASITNQISVLGANDGSATANGSGGSPGYTYSWSNGASTQSISNLGPGTYTVTITDSKGCSTTASVTLNQGPNPCNQDTDPGTVTSSQTFCGPGFDPTNLVGTAPTGGSGTLRYLWMYSTTSGNFGGGSFTGISGATGISYDPGPVYQTTYFVRCSWRGACPEPIETNVVSITVENPDFAQIIGGPKFCPNEEISFSTPDLGAGATYSWEFDSSPISNTASPATSSRRSASTTYSGNNPSPLVKLTVNSTSCKGASQTLRLSKNNDCPPSIIFKTTVNGTKEVKLDWHSLLPDGDYIFEIQRSHDGVNFEPIAEMNGIGDSDAMSYFSYMDKAPKRGESHYRILVLKLDNGMTAASSIEKVKVIWGTTNAFVYPNPTQGNFVVERFETFNSEGSIEIINSRGQVVEVYKMGREQIRSELNLKNLTAGVYMVRITYNNAVEPEVHKFIKR